MFTQRFFKFSILCCLYLLSQVAIAQMGGGGGGGGGGTTIVDPPMGQPFQDPAVMQDINDNPDIVEVNLEAAVTPVNINGSVANLMTYNGCYPGPTIYTKHGDIVKVHFKNSLPATTATNMLGFEKNHTNIHSHGWHVSPMEPADAAHLDIPPGGSYNYVYDLALHKGGNICLYHPHSHGTVAEQFWAGLMGVMVTEDEFDTLDPYETHIMVLKDIKLSGANPTSHSMMMDYMQGKESNLAMINGQVNPVLSIRPGQVQRWRFVNGSNSHFYNLKLEGHTLNLIGTDGGLLDKPYPQNEILLSPGERADVLVQANFTADLNGDGSVNLLDLRQLSLAWLQYNPITDIAPQPVGDGITDHRDYAELMKSWSKTVGGNFKLIAQSYSRMGMGGGGMGGGMGSEGSSSQITMMTLKYQGPAIRQSIPAVIDPAAQRLNIDTAMLPQRTFTLSMMMGRGYINGMDFDVSPYTVMSNIGMYEVWEIVNNSNMDHPWHQHINEAQVLSISGGDSDYSSMLLNTPAMKDVVIVPKMGSVKLLVPVMDYTGMTMFHCHILEHEDIGMMGMWHIMDDMPDMNDMPMPDMNDMNSMGGCGMGGCGNCNGMGGMSGSNSNIILTAKQAQDIIYLREEEKLARDIYQAMSDLYTEPIFANIANAEQCHTNRIKNLIVSYKLTDPVTNDARGVFSNPVFTSLYNSLTAKGASSLKDALEVGVAVEKLDIHDIEVNMLPSVTQSDIRKVLSNLLAGSYSHLNAFNNKLSGL